ncbi:MULTISPECIES: arsenic resistance protein [Paenibacillus]|uniref:Arsenic resistance protein n=1 Tax=Paenibacillus gallinarum TaxID=2762232 RepID=A0ABR8T5R8_9BACL|nr:MULTISPECIES: bile acid:sodium symporter [Paenibacillus]MBD7971067.1 arsenic resistance protein [Paenibacillus gallinarum]
MLITRENLENKQIWIYAVTLIVGGLTGVYLPQFGSSLEVAISPFIAILLYTMFAQIPFLELKKSLSNVKFIIGLLVSNFIVVPIIVWILTMIFPQSPYVLLGIHLVLLTPCIDYVIVFTKLGRGNEKLMLAATPILFVLQMILLPFYLWLFMGEDTAQIVKVEPFLEAFLFLIALPLLLAILTQVWAKRGLKGKGVLQFTTWLPVPFMALVLLVVVASQIENVVSDFQLILAVVPIYLLFHIFMPIFSKMVTKLFKLDVGASRAVVFSSSTRNSLVVLPLALSLPNEYAVITAAVIVTQTIVELVMELFYIKIIPSFVIKEKQPVL